MASYPALDVHFPVGPDTGTLHELLYAELDPFEPLAIHDLPAGDGWRVFFRLAAQRDNARAALASALNHRLAGLAPVEVDDEDWARRSQAALTAIRAGRIIVAPPWDIPEPSLNSDSSLSRSGVSRPNPESGIPDPDLVIVIEPSMGFGTGHHATTRLCLELLQTIDLSGKRVIDVGTGSGVLAIAASKLGASTVIAIDNDPDALENARDNIARNNRDTHLSAKLLNPRVSDPGEPIELVEGDLSTLTAPPADVVTANLTGAVLQRHAAALRRLMSETAVLIVSGFSPEELIDVVAALGLAVTAHRSEAEWAAAILEPSGTGTSET